jgi:hypothetical protein
VLPQYDPDGVSRLFRVAKEDYWPVHNLVLLLTSETGLLGLCAWCALALSVLLAARPREGVSGWHRQWSAAVVAGIIGFLIHNLVDWTYAQVTPLPFFWMMMGLLLTVPTLSGRRVKIDLRLEPLAATREGLCLPATRRGRTALPRVHGG